MKFKIQYIVKHELREKYIVAKDLQEAEIRANRTIKNWIDIYQADFKMGDDVKMKKENSKND
jgi:hypothetical protein